MKTIQHNGMCTALAAATLGMILVGGIAVGCAGADKAPAAAEAPAPPAPALALGEVVLSQAGQPVFKLHADGRSEVATQGPDGAQWAAGPTLAVDGAVTVDGVEKARIATTAITFASGPSLPAAVSTGRVVVGDPGAEVAVSHDAAGNLTIEGGPVSDAMRTGWSIESSDPAASTSAILLWLSLMVPARSDAPVAVP